MRYLLIFLFSVVFAKAQVVTNAASTNAISTNALTKVAYTRLNLRDKTTWASIFSNQRASNASMWQTWWSARWGTNATARTNANPVAQQIQTAPIQAGQTNQLITPPIALPPPPPPPPQPPTNGLANPRGSALQSAIAIDNLNNTGWKGSGWKVVNPYENLIKDARLAGMAQRQFGQNSSFLGGQTQMGGGMMEGGMTGGNQFGGNYGNNNIGMGVPNNMFGNGGNNNNLSQMMSFGGGNFNNMGGSQQPMSMYGAAAGNRMSGFTSGYGNLLVNPYPIF